MFALNSTGSHRTVVLGEARGHTKVKSEQSEVIMSVTAVGL